MSTTQITLETVASVEAHPNADRLDLVQVLGYKVICGRNELKVGDKVIYFPPDILIPEDVAEDLGTKPYLKHAIYPGDMKKSQCRVSSARLRGVPSHGFVIRADGKDTQHDDGLDLTDRFKGAKYEPPVRQGCGDGARDLGSFHRYTNIENIQKFPELIDEGTEVCITEKIHGTNSRIGLCRNEDLDFEFMAGSHNVRRKQYDDSGHTTFYWRPFGPALANLLTELCDEEHDVIVFGEIYGTGVQDMDYGCNDINYRIFDISIDGRYLPFGQVVNICEKFNLQVVPVLAVVPFDLDTVEQYTYGDTTLAKNDEITCEFKGREGVVVKPYNEELLDKMGRRVIVKSVSADYRSRKGATDIE